MAACFNGWVAGRLLATWLNGWVAGRLDAALLH